MRTLPLISLAFVLWLSACKTTCSLRERSKIYLHNFDSSDCRVVVIKEYVPDRRFEHLLNTITLSDTTQPPTLKFWSYGRVTEGVDVSRDVDLLIEFPVIGKTYTVTGRKVNHDKLSTKYCSSGYSYYVDDTLRVYTATGAYPDDDFTIDIYK